MFRLEGSDNRDCHSGCNVGIIPGQKQSKVCAQAEHQVLEATRLSE